MSLDTPWFPYGQTIFRDRRGTQANPYNPDRPLEKTDYDPELTIELPGSHVASSSSSSVRNSTRSQILTEKSLFIADPDADVVAGDRIRVGGTKENLDSGEAYIVDARPAADINPFTGWCPPVEAPLILVEG